VNSPSQKPDTIQQSLMLKAPTSQPKKPGSVPIAPIILLIFAVVAFLFVPTKYVLYASVVGVGFFFLPQTYAIILLSAAYAILIVLAALGVMNPPLAPPIQDDSLKTEHAQVTEISPASLMKVRLLHCDPNTRLLASDPALMSGKANVLEAGPCEFHLLVPGRLGTAEFDAGDYATFQRTKTPVMSIFQTDTVYKMLYRNEGDLKGFIPSSVLKQSGHRK
jgi:hypothetical protein